MALVQEIDYGTPASQGGKTVTLTIDGVAGHGARRHLDHARGDGGRHQGAEALRHDMVEAFGSCRLCLVEIEGRAGTPASCTTPVAEGMVVTTQNRAAGSSAAA